jgi:hypothetical protein
VPKVSSPPCPECAKCPFWQYQECLIRSSRILIYFYCPASEGYQSFYYTSSDRRESPVLAQPPAA